MSCEIDAVDYAVLTCLRQNDACWKKQVYEWVADRVEELPQMEETSAQTIGRRIDTLHEEGRVESRILTPEQARREMIIGYSITEKGASALDAKRGEFLEDVLQAAVPTVMNPDRDVATPVSHAALGTLLIQEFDLDSSYRELLNTVDTSAILLFLFDYYVQENGTRLMSAETIPGIAALAKEPPFQDVFAGASVGEQIRAYLEDVEQQQYAVD